MHRVFPSILFPAFRFQNAMMNAVGGERWWRSKKIELNFAKVAAAKADEVAEARERREALRERERQIRRHMGLTNYYVFFWRRKNYHALYPVVFTSKKKKKKSVGGGTLGGKVAAAGNGGGGDDDDDDEAAAGGGKPERRKSLREEAMANNPYLRKLSAAGQKTAKS